MGNSPSKTKVTYETLRELQAGSHADKTKFVNIITEVSKLAQKGKANLKKNRRRSRRDEWEGAGILPNETCFRDSRSG